MTVPAEDELAVLRYLMGLQLDGADTTPTWETFFPPGAHVAPRATYFLLYHPAGADGSDADDPDVESFVRHTLSDLLRKLRCRTEQRVTEYRGRVRGRVLWPETHKSRYCGDYDPTRYVCREVRRRFDTPENQLLVFVIKALRDCVEAVPDLMRSGICYYPAARDATPRATGRTLGGIGAALGRFRMHARLHDVTMPAAITEVHLRRAEASKIEEYGLVAALYRRFVRTVREESWDEVARSGRRVLPLPARRAGEGDRWIRLAAAVLGSGRGYTARRTAGSPMTT